MIPPWGIANKHPDGGAGILAVARSRGRPGRLQAMDRPERAGTTHAVGAPPAAAAEPTPARPNPAFAHASEAEMARILDFYAVEWRYEPHAFPILWNLDGDVVESFAPDFYLPDFDMYLELTTLRQRLVRKKNRKLRRLRELYPDVRIKLFYARDFRALMLKYGKLALAETLSGSLGQVVPPRLTEPVAAEAANDAGDTEAASVRPPVRVARSRRARRSADQSGPAVVPEARS